MKACPVTFEITDDADELLAIVDCFDASSATVEIKTVVSRHTWPELSAKIAECLSAMQLDGDAVAVGEER